MPFISYLQNGDTPLHVSSLFGHITCTRILISAGSNINMKNKVNVDLFQERQMFKLWVVSHSDS